MQVIAQPDRGRARRLGNVMRVERYRISAPNPHYRLEAHFIWVLFGCYLSVIWVLFGCIIAFVEPILSGFLDL